MLFCSLTTHRAHLSSQQQASWYSAGWTSATLGSFLERGNNFSQVHSVCIISSAAETIVPFEEVLWYELAGVRPACHQAWVATVK